MPLQIIRENIVHMKTDAIVNITNTFLEAGGGVCSSIFDSAGYEAMKKACQKIGHCEIGKAVITPGFDLPAKYVIHTIGPTWRGGTYGEGTILRSCYRSALMLAARNHLETISFPLIETGLLGYPKDKALSVAVSEISLFLMHHEMLVNIVVYDRSSFQLSQKLFDSVSSYIDDKYVDERMNLAHLLPVMGMTSAAYVPKTAVFAGAVVQRKLRDVLKQLDETFSESLIRMIDDKGKTDVEVYKKANIDRKHFSKIKNNKDYRPKKETALALAIGLELSLDETKDLLSRACFALSHASKQDLVVEYFIGIGNYDINQINEVLFAFDQPQLRG